MFAARTAAVATNRVFNVGYEGRSLVDLLDVLATARIKKVIDVRAVPWSLRPEFSERSLRRAVTARGLLYEHQPEAGQPLRSHEQGEPDPHWVQRYQEHLAQNEELVDAIARSISSARTALLCYERHRGHCHRSMLLAVLATRMEGLSVIDL